MPKKIPKWMEIKHPWAYFRF